LLHTVAQPGFPFHAAVLIGSAAPAEFQKSVGRTAHSIFAPSNSIHKHCQIDSGKMHRELQGLELSLHCQLAFEHQKQDHGPLENDSCSCVFQFNCPSAL